MAVYPTSFAMELGLQPDGSFREILVNEDFVVGVWPLAELQSTRARDITGNHNHGTYTGSGFTRGVTVPLPEGALGCTFDGNGYVLVPDDGLTGGLNLSLAAGSADIVFLIKTSGAGSALDGIVNKWNATNGYFVGLVPGGAVRFGLFVGGVSIFDFSRGSIADGQWHLVHCCYEPDVGATRARIFIDGVQSGATVSGVSTEPAYVAVDLAIGGWVSSVTTGQRLHGTLAFVMVGREGNPTLSATLQATRAWTSVNADVRAADAIRWRYGIPGSSVLDNVAQPGEMTFTLDNATSNSAGLLGYYSPGHSNGRSGFRIGIPARFSLTYAGVTRYVFRGQVTAIHPAPGQRRSRAVDVTCSDWFSVAAGVFISAIEGQTNQRSDRVLQLVIDETDGRSPAAVDISTGSGQWPFSLDVGEGESESILTEIARVTASERGYCYPRGDTTQGGTVVWEGRGDRQVASGLDASFDDTMHGLEVDYGLDHLINIVRVVVTPRRVDPAATTVLYTLESSEQDQAIAPGQTVVFEGRYFDPTQEAARVGGLEMVTPVANTDYGFWANGDGTGTDLSATLDVVSSLGGSSFRLEFTNTGTTLGYLRINGSTAFQVRGKGVYHYTPITVERRNNNSVRRYGPRTVQIELPYESSSAEAEGVADFVLGVLSSQRPVPTSLTLKANASATLLGHALDRQPGHKIGITETVTGITSDDPDSDTAIGHYINEVQGVYAAGGIVTVTWTLAPSAPSGAGIFDTSAFDEDFVFGF